MNIIERICGAFITAFIAALFVAYWIVVSGVWNAILASETAGLAMANTFIFLVLCAAGIVVSFVLGVGFVIFALFALRR